MSMSGCMKRCHHAKERRKDDILDGNGRNVHSVVLVFFCSFFLLLLAVVFLLCVLIYLNFMITFFFFENVA